MMTNGPAATIGDIVDVTLARPSVLRPARDTMAPQISPSQAP